MNEAAAQALAIWLQRNEPELFAALAQRAGQAQTLAGITDVLTSIGSGIAKAATSIGSGLATAAKSVGGFLASQNGLSVLSSLGQTYLQTQAQKNALQVQLAQAQAGQPPAPIETRFDPATNTYVPIVTTAGTPQVLTNELTAQLLAGTRGFDWKKALPWLIAGGLGLAVVIWLLTRD